MKFTNEVVKKIIHASPVAWVILLLALLLTYLIWNSLNKIVFESAKQRFESNSVYLKQEIEDRLQVYEHVLNNGVGLFKASDNVNREEFHLYVKNIDIQGYYPGIQGIGYSEVVHPNNLEDFVKQIKNEGYKNFRIHPEGKREIYTSIKYLEPFDDRNKRAFGYDMFAESNRRFAMQRARDTGLASISKKITLLQEKIEDKSDIQAGFLMYVPHYSRNELLDTVEQRTNALQGYVYSAFRMNDLMDEILLNKNTLSNLCIYDGKLKDKNSLMYCSNVATKKGMLNVMDHSDAKFNQSLLLDFGGNSWILKMYSTVDFEEGINKTPLVVAVAGILVSFLLFAIVALVRGKMIEELASAERMQALVLRSTGEGIYGVDLQANCTFINPAALKMLQFEEDEIKGKSLHELIHHTKKDGSKYPEKECPIFEVFEKGKSHNIDNEVFWRKDGTSFPVDYASRPLVDENKKVIGAVVSFNDVTERLQIEAEIAKQNAELARSNEELQQFAYVASHDLQEPLRKILTFGDRLSTKESINLSESGKNYVERMQNSARRMRNLINDLLSYSRISTTENQFEWVSLNSIIDEVIDDLEARIKETDGKIEIGKLPNVMADAMQMHQLFQNLISNALKFNRQSVAPVVTINNTDIVSTSNKFCRITVQDNGVGFDNQYSEKIFAPFQRLHGRREYEGTGIGLAICQKIIERHEGKISVNSMPDEGTTFTIELPIH